MPTQPAPPAPLLPPATLGLLGGGQLGRMFAATAQRMGYSVWVLDPARNAPAAHFATRHIVADYDDPAALAELADHCAAITTEFENPPAHALATLALRRPVRPNARAVEIAQDRILEKTFLQENGFPLGPFAIIETASDLSRARDSLKYPAILKTARLGYDGRGQITVNRPEDLHSAWAEMHHVAAVLEERLSLHKECSVVLARGADGTIVPFPITENRHTRGILDLSIVPAELPAHIELEARDVARRIAAKLDYVGVMAVEFFVVRGQLFCNEMAPRPHNSGHHTIESCVTDQFEQQVRALCGLPLGDASLIRPAVMINILGDAWGRHGPQSQPDWLAVLAEPGAQLHLYGKDEPRRGRKMGHVTVTAPTREAAIEKALRLRGGLVG